MLGFWWARPEVITRLSGTDVIVVDPKPAYPGTVVDVINSEQCSRCGRCTIVEDGSNLYGRTDYVHLQQLQRMHRAPGRLEPGWFPVPGAWIMSRQR